MESKRSISRFKTVEYPAVPNSREISPEEFRFSDNYYLFKWFRQFIRDGIELDLKLRVEDNLPFVSIQNERLTIRIRIYLIQPVENFIFKYLLTGRNTGTPSYPNNCEIIHYRAPEDYFYGHIKREIARGKFTYKEEKKDGMQGCRIIGEYPYGTIDYGFIPHSFNELESILKDTRDYIVAIEEEDIPRFKPSQLPIIYKEIKQGSNLDSVFNEIPSNAIIDKTICGCGATWLEIHSDRPSIIIEPNIPVIIGKQQEHPHIIGVYGDKIKDEDVAESIKKADRPIKIMTTPDSFPKVKKGLQLLRVNYFKEFFLLFDECEKIVTDIDFRPNIFLPIDDFFRFDKKAMVSATPIIIDDPRFGKQNFEIIKIKPAYDYCGTLELKPTNNVLTTFKRTIQGLSTDKPVFIFYNSIQGIKELISFLKIDDESNIYCSTDALKELKKEGYSNNVFDSLADKSFRQYNFLTSRFYSAVDIKLDYKPVVIMVSNVYKTMPGQTPYSLIDPQTEAVQIAGRFRNGVDKLIHITNTNSKIEFKNQDKLETFLKEQHAGYLKMVGLEKTVKDEGEKYIISQAISKTDYVQQGYVTEKGEINYFRYNNAYADERLKFLYRFPAALYKAYKESGAFDVITDSIYSAYTDEERNQLKNNNLKKSKRIQLLYETYNRLIVSQDYLDYQFLNELKKEFPIYLEAFNTIGYKRVKELGYKDADIKKEVKDIKRLEQVKSKDVVSDVYMTFTPDTYYSNKFINQHLKAIYDKHKIEYDGRGTAKLISLYYQAKESRRSNERGWQLGNRLLDK